MEGESNAFKDSVYMSNVKFDFSNKNFIVTGASSGMGRQVVVELAAAGANVLAIARRENELLTLQELYPDRISLAAIDVCDYGNLEIEIREFVEKFGKLSGAVHAAGIVNYTAFKMYDEIDAKKIYEVSFWGGIKFIQICAKTKLANKGASFVLFSSTGSYNAARGMFAYASAKAAVRVAVRSIAKEICKNQQRINTVSPGWVKSNMTNVLNETKDIKDIKDIKDSHLLGVGEAEDVSGVVLFLLSDRADWITGTDIVVDGGYLA